MKKRIIIEWERSTLRNGRLRVPAGIRNVWQRHNVQTLYLTHGVDGCLFLFTEHAWAAHAARFRMLPFRTPAVAKRLQRLFFSDAMPVRPDAAGCILVPPALIAFARLRRSVVLVQHTDRIELWDQGQWAAHLRRTS